jgi:hypothetical protein
MTRASAKLRSLVGTPEERKALFARVGTLPNDGSAITVRRDRRGKLFLAIETPDWEMKEAVRRLLRHEDA